MKFTNEQIEQGLDKIFDNLLQTKDVEASESMEITPDEGYAGIKKVNLTVKGGGGGSASQLYYKIDWSKIDGTEDFNESYPATIFQQVGALMTNAVVITNGRIMINSGLPAACHTLMQGGYNSVVGFSAVESMRVVVSINGTVIDQVGSINDVAAFKSMVDSKVFIPISEEDYYNIATYA